MKMYGDFYDFPERFKNLPKNMQTKGKEEAKKYWAEAKLFKSLVENS